MAIPRAPRGREEDGGKKQQQVGCTYACSLHNSAAHHQAPVAEPLPAHLRSAMSACLISDVVPGPPPALDTQCFDPLLLLQDYLRRCCQLTEDTRALPVLESTLHRTLGALSERLSSASLVSVISSDSLRSDRLCAPNMQEVFHPGESSLNNDGAILPL